MKSFFKKRRRPEKHLRKTQKGFSMVNPDISYDHVTGLDVGRISNAKMNDGLKQEASGAMLELQQAVANRKAKKQAELEKAESARRKEKETQLNKLVDMKAKCDRSASREAEALFEMKATANFNPESLEVEYITPDKYDIDPTEPFYSDVEMSGHVLLGSGEDKIRLDVVATSKERDFSGVSPPSSVKFHYTYNGILVNDPLSLSDAIESEKNRVCR